MVDILQDDKRLENLKRLAAVSGQKGATKLVEMAALSRNSIFMGKLENFLGKTASIKGMKIHPFLPGPSPEELMIGDINLGLLSDGSPVMLPSELLSQGLGIVGTTGAGKTWDLAFICKQLIARGINIWWFDKENEVHKFFTKELRNGEVLALNYKDLKRNPFEPLSGELTNETINRIASRWRGPNFFRDGSENLLVGKLDELFRNINPNPTNKYYPSIITLHNALSKMKFNNFNSRQAQYWESLMNRTSKLVTQMGDVYNCSMGFDVDKLLNHSIIWRLQGLSSSLHQFFIEDLIGYAISYKERTMTNRLTNIFVIDEAHRLLTSDPNRNDLEEPFIFQLARTTRKRGSGLIIADQVASEIPSSVLANLNTRIVFRIFNGPCIKRIGASMALTNEQMDYLPQMPLRTAIIHSLIYPSPFLIEIPELTFDQMIGDEELNQICNKASTLFEYTSDDTNTYKPPMKVDNTPLPLLTWENSKSAKLIAGPLIKEETDYLIAIAQNPFISVTQLDRYCKISLYKGHQLRSKLAAREYTQAHKIKTGKKGNPITILEITGTGWQYLESIKAKVEKYKGVGGFIHCYWQSKIKEWYERKYETCKAIIEDKSSGKAVDVGIHFGNKNTAVEIMIKGEQKEISNINKDMENYDVVMCCAEDWEALNSLKERVEKEVEADKRNRVWFKVLGGFLVNDNSASPSQSSGSDD